MILFDYLRRGSGIDFTAGALLVVASTAILLIAALILALRAASAGWGRTLLLAASILDVFGTALAAYFLHAWVVLALMAAALLAWLVVVFSGSLHDSARGATA